VRQLQRNAFIEAGLGAVVLLVVGALGTTPPALHVQPQWPLPFRLSLDALEARPGARSEALAATIIAFGGLALLAYGLLRPRQRVFQLLAGLFAFIAVGWWPLQFMIVTAYPTTFSRSAVPLTASSIAHGAALYADDCTACHGVEGHGDGPVAKSTPVKPADLTAEHIFEHSDGDLFWWISNGIPTGGMPGFAEALDERQRWDIINFLHARAAAVQPKALQSQVMASPAPLAPDFTFEQHGGEATLRQRLERGPVLLVFYELPQSQGRLKRLAAVETQLAAQQLQLLALPLEAEEARAATPLPDFAATADSEVATAYHLFMGAGDAAPAEFLIDRAGFLRARWKAGATAGLPNEATLLAQLDRLKQLPLEEQTHAHAH
jgi:putative copper resistance protein D